MEVTAFHRNLIRSSLWPYSSPYTPQPYKYGQSVFSGRPLTVILLYGVRTFLPPTHYAPASDCLACFTGVLYRARGLMAGLGEISGKSHGPDNSANSDI